MFKNAYYWIYKSHKNTRTNDTPATTSLVMLTILEGINVLSFLFLFQYFFQYNFSSDFMLLIAITVYIVLILIGYFFFYKKRDEIVQNHENKSQKQKLWSKISFWIYIGATFFIFYKTWYIVDAVK
ncbi:MAG: hypothetical protein HXX09_15450 [Bacteroidetes bacterium]|nr:hypothetical protein [Bacteroidota bacterium]